MLGVEQLALGVDGFSRNNDNAEDWHPKSKYVEQQVEEQHLQPVSLYISLYSLYFKARY